MVRVRIDGIDLPDAKPVDINKISGRVVQAPEKMENLTEEQMMDIMINTNIMDL